MTWSIWLPRGCSHCLLFSVHRERYLQLIYFLLVSLPEWFASTMAESAGPLRRMVSGQHQKVLSRRWVAPFSRISKKRSEMGEGRSAVPSFFVPRFSGNSLPCNHVLHMTWRYPYSRLERWRSWPPCPGGRFTPCSSFPHSWCWWATATPWCFRTMWWDWWDSQIHSDLTAVHCFTNCFCQA